ncbi:MAG TPA: NAD(P)/FAD-dependent oxidoreductase [Streptosporangiaceae bacterium]|nr:NAD(P)/FAD-dependent oxidoreductase [Streptosporangiaceae bacterium]
MADAFDVVVAGAGHNSLVAAAYLAKAGLSCIVLEAADDIGGDTGSQELTLPGFLHDTCSTAHNLIQASPILADDELGLAAHGLEYLHPDPVVHLPFPDGTWLTMWRDEERTCAEFAKFSRRDADAYRAMMARYREVAPDLGRARYTPVGHGESASAVLARQPGGSRWLRRNGMSAWEVIAGEFSDEHTRAFMLWMSFMTMQPPERPGTGLLAYSLAYGRQRHSWTLPRGGSATLPKALARVIESHGGVIRTGARVTGLVLAGDRCTGVETESGERYLATRAVLSTIHIKHLVEMAPPGAWGDDFRYGVDTWQPGISMFVSHYATTVAPEFGVDGGTIRAVASGTPQSADRMLRLATDFRAGRIATDDPVLLVLCPTVADPSRAPDGAHTLKVVGFQPYELVGGPERWDDVKQQVSAANLAELRRYAANLTDDVVLASAVKSPLDLERMNAHNWHGSCHGGDAGPAQSGELRPVPGWASHRMPISGLYQTGATTYPGGSVSGAPGRNAATVMLADLGSSLAAAVAGR